MMQLETKQLVLRDWKETDLDDLYDYAKVEGVGEMAGWPHHTDKIVSERVLKDFIKKGDVYALVLKENNKVIGSLGIHDRAMDPGYEASCQREIGYVLSKAYWGKGLMVEAVQAAIAYAFEVIQVEVLWCGHFVSNNQSKRVVEKSGFKFYGDGTHDSFLLKKQFDTKRYLLTKEDYFMTVRS